MADFDERPPDRERDLPTARDLLDLEPERWLRKVPGRETFPWPGSGEPRLVVKRYRGDHPRDVWYERLRGRRPRSPGEREFDNLRRLEELGFRVPRAVDWAEEAPGSRGAAGARSAVAMRWVRHGETLRERLGRAAEPERRRWLAALAELTARLHGAGAYHRDLYTHHLVLSGASDAPDLTLLDLGRVRFERRPRRRWLVKDLGALAHSLPSSVAPEEAREALFGRYFDLAGVATLAARGRWERAIERRRRRIAAHVPRHGEDPA